MTSGIIQVERSKSGRPFQNIENYKKDVNVKSVTLYRIDQTFEF